MGSCERGKRSSKSLQSFRGERRVPTAQVFQDATENGLPSPCIAVWVPPGGGVLYVSSCLWREPSLLK